MISALAFKLCSIRDMGEGLIAARPGRKYAPHSLVGHFGLTLRLTRTAFIGWLSACFIAGMGFGTGFEDFETFIGDNEYLQTLLGDGAVEYYIAMLISMLVMIVAIPAISIIFKVKNEEKENRIEHLYARNVSKVGTLFEYVIISFIGSILMLLSSIAGLWCSTAMALEEPILFGTLLKAGMVYLPAIWILIGVSVFIIGVFPKVSFIAWAYLGFSFLVIYLGPLMQLPEWLGGTTPFGNIPQIPVEEFNWSPLCVMTLIALLMIALGFIGYRNRDISDKI
jgi:ABC-2 type transport system permease protein